MDFQRGAPSGSRTASWVINSDICAAETEGRRRGNEEAFSPEQRGKSGKTTPRGGRDGRRGGVEEGERRKTTQRCDWTKASVCLSTQTGSGSWREYDYEDDWTKLPTSQIILLGNSGKASYWLTPPGKPFSVADPNSHVHTVAPCPSSGR